MKQQTDLKTSLRKLRRNKYFLLLLILLLTCSLVGAVIITTKLFGKGGGSSSGSELTGSQNPEETTPTPTSDAASPTTSTIATPSDATSTTTPEVTSTSSTTSPTVTATIKATTKPTTAPTNPPTAAPTAPPVAVGTSCGNPNKLANSITELANLVKTSVPGDHIRLMASVTGQIKLDFPAGNASRYICVSYAPGVVSTGLVRINSARYVVLENIKSTWSNADGPGDHMFKLTGGNNWILRNSEIWGAQSFANILVTGGALNWKITNNYIHDVANSPVNSTVQNHNIYVAQGDYGLIAGNRIKNAPRGRCIKIANASATNPDQPDHNKVLYNTFVNCQGPSLVGVSYSASYNEFSKNIFVTGPCIMNVNDITGAGNTMIDNIYWNITGDCIVSDTANFSYSGMLKINPGLNGADLPTNGGVAGYGYGAYHP